MRDTTGQLPIALAQPRHSARSSLKVSTPPTTGRVARPKSWPPRVMSRRRPPATPQPGDAICGPWCYATTGGLAKGHAFDVGLPTQTLMGHGRAPKRRQQNDRRVDPAISIVLEFVYYQLFITCTNGSSKLEVRDMHSTAPSTLCLPRWLSRWLWLCVRAEMGRHRQLIRRERERDMHKVRITTCHYALLRAVDSCQGRGSWRGLDLRSRRIRSRTARSRSRC